MTHGDLHDRRAEFLIAVGDLCRAAALAHLRVELATADGKALDGVPSSLASAEGEHEVDDTGLAEDVSVGDASLALIDVVTCTVFSPPVPLTDG